MLFRSAAAAAVAEVVEPVKEKDAFDIKLTVVDPKSKIKIIKEVRALTGLGLKEVRPSFLCHYDRSKICVLSRVLFICPLELRHCFPF